LTAFLRQEVQAPATAVTDLLDMIIEDARSSQPKSMLADLNRMRGASVQLNAFVKGLIRDSSARNDEALEEFHRRLRHDLRTPLNAIKGYSELLLEDMDTDATHPLRLDLAKLKDAADQLLGQIDAMAALARRAFASSSARIASALASAGSTGAQSPTIAHAGANSPSARARALWKSASASMGH